MAVKTVKAAVLDYGEDRTNVTNFPLKLIKLHISSFRQMRIALVRRSLLRFSAALQGTNWSLVSERVVSTHIFVDEMETCQMAKSLAEALKSSLSVRFLSLCEGQRETTDKDPADNVSWDHLPYNILVTICKHLHDKDRGRMAFVCKSWYQATRDPALWRSHVFFLYSSCEAPVGMSWLRSRVHYLRHATIMCFGNFDRYRDQFLRALQHANLLNLDINGAAYWWASGKDLASLSRVVARIVRLLKTQRQLVGFQMRQAMLDFSTGMGVLNALAVSSGETITRLGLEDFFGDKIVLKMPCMPEKFARDLQKFPNLNDLTINFEYITDNMLYWLGKCGKNKTIHLNLVSWLTVMPTPKISRDAWATLASAGPDIRVYLILQNIQHIREVIEDILMPDIPLCRLDLVGVAALGTDMIPEVVNLLCHVGQCYGQRLRGFRLWCDNDVCDEIEETLLNVLRQMTRLRYLDLHMDVRAELIGQICTRQIKGETRLETLRMARSLSDCLEFDLFRREVRTWFPVLKELKLDFHLRAESAPYHSAWNEYVFIIADSAGIVDSEENNQNVCHHDFSNGNSSTAIANDNNNNNNNNVWDITTDDNNNSNNVWDITTSDNNNNNNVSDITTSDNNSNNDRLGDIATNDNNNNNVWDITTNDNNNKNNNNLWDSAGTKDSGTTRDIITRMTIQIM